MLVSQSPIASAPADGLVYPDKYAEYRDLTTRLLLGFAALILVLWAWDWQQDPAYAMTTLCIRIGAALLALVPVAAIVLKLAEGTVGVSIYGVILMVELLFTVILSRLEGGFATAIGGYLYFVLAVVLLGLPFGLRVNIIGSIAVAISPLFYGHLVSPEFPHVRYAVSVWPAFAIGMVFHWGAHRLIMENLRSKLQIEAMSLTDPLTGMHNRRALEASFARARAMVARDGGQVCLIIIDIDHFKRINDTYGHGAGDKVLKDLAGLIMGNLRPTDDKARTGGEEFVCLLPNSSLADVASMGERLRCAVEKFEFQIPFNGGSVAEHITISLGATCWQAPETLDDAIARADEALYEAKRAGRNRLLTRVAPDSPCGAGPPLPDMQG